jgi:hypothetical protein
MSAPLKFELDRRQGVINIGYGAGSSPSFTNLTVTSTLTVGGSVHGANGSAGNPSFAFNSNQNTGIYRIGPDNIGVTANGAKVLDIATTGLTVTGALGASSLTSPAGIDLTLAGGSSGASLVLGQGTAASATVTTTGASQFAVGTSLYRGNKAQIFAGNNTPASSGTTQNGGLRLASLATGSGGYVLDVGVSDSSAYAWLQVSNSGNLAPAFGKPIALNPIDSNVLIGGTTDISGTGGLKIFGTTAGSSGAGALVVTGGLSAGGASYFGGAVTVGGGTVTVGTTTNGKLNLYESFSSPGAAGIDIQHVTGTSGNTFYATFQYAAGVLGSITQFSTTGVLYNTASDYRLKDITGPLTNSGAFIDSLKPKTGTWKADGSKFVGFLAHEFAEVCPSAVTGEKDAVDAEGKPVYQAMQASAPEVMANLVAEIQSLRKRLAALEAK